MRKGRDGGKKRGKKKEKTDKNSGHYVIASIKKFKESCKKLGINVAIYHGGSKYKVILLGTLGAGCQCNFQFFFIQAKFGKAPVCSSWITQVNINFINYPLTPLINH